MSEKLAFLYVGLDGNGTAYPPYSDTDLDNLQEANEFVITSANYDNYLSPNNSSALTAYLDQVVELARKIINKYHKNVWLGTPHVPVLTQSLTLPGSISTYESYASKIRDCIATLKEKINWQQSTDLFATYVRGVYMNHEHIHTNVYQETDKFGTPIDHTSLSSMVQHPEVALFKGVSDYVHTIGKEMMWVPYYGVGDVWDTTIDDVAYIANRTNIFNLVFLQPQYYFTGGDSLANIAAVKQCVSLNRVVSRANTAGWFPEVCSKTSNTLIGCQLEVDDNFCTTPELIGRFRKYQDAYAIFVNNHPLSFYLGFNVGGTAFPVLCSLVKYFYNPDAE